MRYWHVLTRLRGTVCSSMLKQKSTSYSCSFSWFQGCDCGRAGCRTTDPHKDCFSTESTWFVFNHNPLLLDAVLEFKVYISRVFRYFSVRTISSWCFLTSTESTVLNRSQFQTFIPLRLRRLGIAHCSLPQQARATRGDRQAISQNISTSAATASTYCGTAGSKAWPGKRTCHSLHEELNFPKAKTVLWSSSLKVDEVDTLCVAVCLVGMPLRLQDVHHRPAQPDLHRPVFDEQINASSGFQDYNCARHSGTKE